jgi:hypothetical protein
MAKEQPLLMSTFKFSAAVAGKVMAAKAIPAINITRRNPSFI